MLGQRILEKKYINLIWRMRVNVLFEKRFTLLALVGRNNMRSWRYTFSRKNSKNVGSGFVLIGKKCRNFFQLLAKIIVFLFVFSKWQNWVIKLSIYSKKTQPFFSNDKRLLRAVWLARKNLTRLRLDCKLYNPSI